MISEMFIKKYDGRKGVRVIVYPLWSSVTARVYDNPSKSSCRRLESMVKKYDVSIYINKHGISIWFER